MFTSDVLQKLSIDDIRIIFGEHRNTEDSAKAFIRERFLRIQAEDGIMPVLISNGALVMHLVPLPDFEVKHKNEIPALKDLNGDFSTIRNNCSRGINLEGYFFSDYKNDDTYFYREYTQVFRDGVLEVVSADLFTSLATGGFGFSSCTLPKYIVSALKRYMRGLRKNGAKQKILLQISFMKFQNMKIVNDNYGEEWICNRDILHLPSSLITEYNDGDDYTDVAMEQMDFLWNAFGLDRCRYKDFDGIRENV